MALGHGVCAFACAPASFVVRERGERLLQLWLWHEKRRRARIECLACLGVLARVARERQVVGGVGRRAGKTEAFLCLGNHIGQLGGITLVRA